MNQFQAPPFRPHLFLRGGHLQTIIAVHNRRSVDLPTERYVIPLGDGDAIVLHQDVPAAWRPGDASLLLVHGLCGCHAASYMLRLADQFFRRGVRVYRLDMRGCGAASGLAKQITHAGRSDDLIAALKEIAQQTGSGKIGVIAISMGGNQLLRGLGRIGAGIDTAPDWFDRLDRVAAIAPPIDLPRCSENMDRWILRPYNNYFIRRLLQRVPAQVREREDYQQVLARPRPKTMRQLDELITAPLSGFSDASEYYQWSSAMHVTADNPVQTLVIAAADDPVVPVGCFTDGKVGWSESTELLVSRSGGHVGFIDRQKRSWMDHVLGMWFESFETRSQRVV